MSTAYDDHRVGLWCNSPSNMRARSARIAAFNSGMFSDVFLPLFGATAADFAFARNIVRPRALPNMRAQAFTFPTSSDPHAVAASLKVQHDLKSPGVTDLDYEENGLTGFGAAYADWLETVLGEIRAVLPLHIIRLNIAPHKVLLLKSATIMRLQTDTRLYLGVQTYYGDMARVAEDEMLMEAVAEGIPWQKVQMVYGAATITKGADGFSRRGTLPNIYYEGQLVAQIRKGLVFTDDLMVENGML